MKSSQYNIEQLIDTVILCSTVVREVHGKHFIVFYEFGNRRRQNINQVCRNCQVAKHLSSSDIWNEILVSENSP